MAPNGKAAMDYFNSSAFDSHANDLIKKWNVPGLSVALTHEESTSSKAFGLSALDPPRKCTPDTLFDIASASKSTTAGAVALLVDDDERFPQVQWETPMSTLLPDDFVMSKEDHTRNVTVEDILSHRSGLPGHDDSFFGPPRSSHGDTARSVTRNLRNLEISQPMRTKEQYCNQMYTVASFLVEKLTSKTFEKFLHERIWSPLGMLSTHLQPSAATKAGLSNRMATPYTWKDDKNDYLALNYEETPEAQGAGSVWTSVVDYIKWVDAVMSKKSPITDNIYSGLTKPRIFSNPDDDLDDLDPYTSFQAYAAGWEVYFYRGCKVVQHDGLISGFSSVHFFVPECKLGGVILGNSENAGTVGEILLKELADEMLQVPKSDRVDWNARQHKAQDEYKDKEKEERESLRKELSTNGDGEAEPQKMPLSAYVGEYWNAGYQGMTVSFKDDHLHIDASDRTGSFLLDLEHMSGQKLYLARLTDLLNGDDDADRFKVEFRFDPASNTPVKMGLKQEPNLDGLIWYDRVEGSESQKREKVALR